MLDFPLPFGLYRGAGWNTRGAKLDSWTRVTNCCWKPWLALLLAAMLAGCAAPEVQDPGDAWQAPRLTSDAAEMDDGYLLPLRRWGDREHPRALVLALHGFNDYGNAFAELGTYLARYGVVTHAYDQRGFGATAQRGRWAGTERMAEDLRAVARLLRRRYHDAPLFILGESMGGALVMTAAPTLEADGLVLLAPAVWSRDTMNPLQRFALWIAAHTVPGLALTGDGLDIRPSDNEVMLRAFSADPLVIKETRVDALWGITDLMDHAVGQAARAPASTLVLYGERDQIIPKRAFCAALAEMESDPRLRLAIYADGWHMLTRDLQGERVMADIAAWILDPRTPLPSGEETRARSKRVLDLCPDHGPPSLVWNPASGEDKVAESATTGPECVGVP
jgi:alpha-beta hydrolase superfamily lysophospholipase